MNKNKNFCKICGEEIIINCAIYNGLCHSCGTKPKYFLIELDAGVEDVTGFDEAVLGVWSNVYLVGSEKRKKLNKRNIDANKKMEDLKKFLVEMKNKYNVNLVIIGEKLSKYQFEINKKGGVMTINEFVGIDDVREILDIEGIKEDIDAETEMSWVE